MALLLLAGRGFGQEAPEGPVGEAVRPSEAPARVDVKPQSLDAEISARLQGILDATGWFTDAGVRAEDGVVFLSGTAPTEEVKEWAGDLAGNTEDVVAVVNRIEVSEPAVWDFAPTLAGLRDLWRSILHALPFVAFALLVLLITWVVARLCSMAVRRPLRRRVSSPLLRDLIARAVGLAVFVAGLYIVFRVAGLTGVALTVIGGTGLVGLVLGVAFRGITENFLASIFLSVQNPFRTGDLVDIAGVMGYVQRLTTRTTVLMTLDGDPVQIPNATVYPATIRNYTSNPNRRQDFTVGIGYDAPIARAQDLALRVLAEHPAVLSDPEPWVLVDGLGAATVTLRIYFWIDGSQHSWVKVRSSVIRLVKRAFQVEGISMPDEAREMLFPEGVAVRLVERAEAAPEAEARREAARASEEPATVSTESEGDLLSEAQDIQEQARQSRTPEEGENLLEPEEPAE